MKSKYFLSVSVLTIIILVGLTVFSLSKGKKPSFAVEKIDNRGIYIGEKEKMNGFSDRSITGDIDYAWDNIEIGNGFFRSGNYEQALVAYRKAYLVQVASRSLSGLKLARTYEKLSRYDEGVAVIDDMIKNGYLSDTGIDMAEEVRSRLLAAKNQAEQEQ